MDSPSALAETQEWLMAADNPVFSLVVMTPPNRAAARPMRQRQPVIAKMIKPWREVGAGVLVVDHQPNAARIDR